MTNMSSGNNKPPIHIALPSTGEDEWQAVREPLMSGWLTQGPKVAAFEKAFAERHEVEHALATTSCTTALHLALAAMDIGPGDEVIVPAFTWVATANVVLYCGATPVLVDVDPDTFNLDIDKAAEALTARTKAVIAVHLFGLCVDVERLRSVIPEEVFILEDAACAAGAALRGTPAGGLGDAAAFSFHPRKSITTGEGGMLTTVDAGISERANMLRNHGASVSEEQRHQGPKPYLLPEFNLLGFNYRMTDLQGAVGLVQLSKLDRFIAERAQWADWYAGQFADLDWLRTPSEPSDGVHAWQAFVCRIDPGIAPRSRDAIMEILQAQGIATRPGTHAVHTLGLYRQRLGCTAEQYPNASECEHQSIALPLHNRMSPEDYERVVAAVRGI